MQVFTVPYHDYSFGFFSNYLSVFSVDGNDFLPGSVCRFHPSVLSLFVVFVANCSQNLCPSYCLLGSKSPGGSGLQAHRTTLIGEPGQAANSKLELHGGFIVGFGLLFV